MKVCTECKCDIEAYNIDGVKSKNEQVGGCATWKERASWVGGSAGGHPRLDIGRPLSEANKPARIQVATCKVWTRFKEHIQRSLMSTNRWNATLKLGNLPPGPWVTSYCDLSNLDLVSTSGSITQSRLSGSFSLTHWKADFAPRRPRVVLVELTQ